MQTKFGMAAALNWQGAPWCCGYQMSLLEQVITALFAVLAVGALVALIKSDMRQVAGPVAGSNYEQVPAKRSH